MNASNVGIKIIVGSECEERKSCRTELSSHFFVLLQKIFSTDQNSKLTYIMQELHLKVKFQWAELLGVRVFWFWFFFLNQQLSLTLYLY